MVTREEAAAARSAAMSSRRDEVRAALGVERAGYVMRGLPDRVAAVDEQLRLLDATAPEAETSEVAPVEDATAPEVVETATRRRKR